MSASIFKHYPLSISDFDLRALRLTDEESRQLESLMRREKRVDSMIANAHCAEHGFIKEKITKEFIEVTINPLVREKNGYRSQIKELLVSAVDRDFELKFNLNQEKIFDDVKEKVEIELRDTKRLDEVVQLLKQSFVNIDNQAIFPYYAGTLFYETARLHWNYCSSHNLEECKSKISEYIMNEARKQFKTDYGIEPNCDFSILKYNKYFADFRKPNERMLDPMKLEDSTVSYELENMTLQFEKHKKLNSSGKKMLIFLLYNFTNSDIFHDRSLKFALSDYMTLCDLKSKNNAIKQIRSGLENLFSLSVTLKGKEKNQGSFRFRRLIADAGLNINNGYINIEITSLFLELTKTSRVLILPQQYFRINLLHFPNSPDILMKASEQKSMNHKSSNNDILTIRTLLEACSGLPKYEDIKSQGRINQRIKEPFFRDLDHLSETFTYELYTADKVKITVEEAKALPFEEFENIRVHIKWNDFPERKISPSQKN